MNIKTKLLTIVLLAVSVLVNNGVFAQEIIFCEGNTERGEPKGELKDEWSLDKGGAKVHILYNNGKTTINYAKLYILIEEKEPKENPEKLTITVNRQNNWAAIDYNFTKVGEFMISVFGIDNNVLASRKITIKGSGVAQMKEAMKVEKVELSVELPGMEEQPQEEKAAARGMTFEKEEVTRVHQYDDSKLSFGQGFDEKLVRPTDKFALGKSGVYVAMLLENSKSLNTSTITVDVWKKGVDGDYTEHIGAKEVKVKSDKKVADFHYSFFKPGEYKVSIFSGDFTWICSNYLTVYGE